MHLAIDASRANSTNRTGVEWYLYHLILELKKIIPADVSVVLYTREKLIPDANNWHILPVNWQNKVLRWPPKIFWTQIRLSFEMLFRAPDVLFIPAHVIPLIHSRIFSRKKTKVIVTLHDVAFIKFPDIYNRREMWYQRLAIKLAEKFADAIITISEATKRDLVADFKVNPEKITVIPLAYDANNYQVISDQARIKQVLDKYKINRPFLLYVGRLEQKKNTLAIIRSFVDLFKENKNLQLVLVGNPGFGYEKIDEELEKLSPDIKKNIKILGWLPSADTATLLNAATVFVFPSLYEGFGMPILEAMACGCPVITSNISACPEVAGTAARLINPNNVSELTIAISLVLRSEEDRIKLVNAGFERVKMYNWQLTAQKTFAHICQVAPEFFSCYH